MPNTIDHEMTHVIVDENGTMIVPQAAVALGEMVVFSFAYFHGGSAKGPISAKRLREGQVHMAITPADAPITTLNVAAYIFDVVPPGSGHEVRPAYFDPETNSYLIHRA